MKKSILFLFLLLPCLSLANVCTPVNFTPVQGGFGPIVNGIDAVGSNTLRYQWTSDATSGTPSTARRVQWATNAEWASNPGVYPHQVGTNNGDVVSDSTTYQGNIVSNLPSNTSGHIIGQSLQGGVWCTAPDETWTTPVFTNVTPQLPKAVSGVTPHMAKPAITGTHWLYGSNCGTVGTVTQNLQDCFTKAVPGDGIDLPPGLYQTMDIYTPDNPNAVAISSCTAANPGVCTVAGTAPANGTQIRMSGTPLGGGQDGVPVPLQYQVVYTVVNSTGVSHTFQVSYDGVTPLAFTTTGGTGMKYLPQNAQNWIVVSSTASSSLLPPNGVRADLSYAAQMPNLQLTAPDRSLLNFTNLASYYWMDGIEITTDPAVYTASGNGVDPVSFDTFLTTLNTNDHIVFNRCIIHPALPPSRSFFWQFDGSNMAVMNSYVDGLDYWQPFRKVGIPTQTSNTITYAAGVYYWVGSGGTIGTKKTCNTPAWSITFTGGTGSYYNWISPTDCSVNVLMSTGMTATTTGGPVTVTTTASPDYPRFTYTSPTGGVYNSHYNVLTEMNGTVSSGTITSLNNDFGLSNGRLESGVGIHVGSGPGPFLFANNGPFHGGGVVGDFLSDDLTNGTSPCGYAVKCELGFNTGNVQEIQSAIGTNPCYFADSSCWNGGDYSWRNTSEFKQGKFVQQDGNIYGPMYAQVGQGGCADFTNYQQGFPNGIMDYVDSSEHTFTNNTCWSVGGFATTASGFNSASINVPMPLKDVLLENNLLIGINGYNIIPVNSPTIAGLTRSNAQSSCAYGKLLEWGGNGQNFQFNHNTVLGQGGCWPILDDMFQTLGGGVQFNSNILNLVLDPGTFSGSVNASSYYQSTSILDGGGLIQDIPNCSGYSGNTLFACQQDFYWRGNVLLGTWANSDPVAGLVDLTNAQIATSVALLPTNTFVPNAGTTYANRLAQVSFNNPNYTSPTSGLWNLTSASPYIGSVVKYTLGSDGKDAGVDFNKLQIHQGWVQNVRSTLVSTTSATVSFLAPDSFGCTVDWTTTNFNAGSFTRVANAGGDRSQNVSLTGLPLHSTVTYRVNCPVFQPQGTIVVP